MDFSQEDLKLISIALIGQSMRSREFAHLQRHAGFAESADRQESMATRMFDLWARVHVETSTYEQHMKIDTPELGR